MHSRFVGLKRIASIRPTRPSSCRTFSGFANDSGMNTGNRSPRTRLISNGFRGSLTRHEQRPIIQTRMIWRNGRDEAFWVGWITPSPISPCVLVEDGHFPPSIPLLWAINTQMSTAMESPSRVLRGKQAYALGVAGRYDTLASSTRLSLSPPSSMICWLR